MAKIEGEGFCNRACEIDEYEGSIKEMRVMLQLADLEPDQTDRFKRKTRAIEDLVAFQSEILETCESDAKLMPCEGYNEAGVVMGGLMTGMTIHCPVVLHQFRNAVE